MKTTKYPINIGAVLIAALALLTGIAACNTDPVSETGGLLPDEKAMGQIGSAMRSNLSFSSGGEVILATGEEGEEPKTVLADQLVYTLSKPVQAETKATLSLGAELTPEFLAEVERENERLKAYNKIMHTEESKVPLFGAALFPTANVQLEADALTVPAGKTSSQTIKVTLSNKGLAKDTLYLLPLVARRADNSEQILQYIVKWQVDKLKWENSWDPSQGVIPDPLFTTVFYVNTETYQPLVADIYGYQTFNNKTQEQMGYSIGNIVNLKTATVGYAAATGRVLMNPEPDLRYVLEHAHRYIRPVQENEHKVCLCIQGGGKGIGFCNMSDAQIADFAEQVKEVINKYKLDGVNLYDEKSGYGKEGMPAVNTTSYPKLIKALREALPGKLLTLVDKGEPTEYFYDAAACGGIEVGKLIDYAWHGYNNGEEAIQVIEPWATDHPYSEYTRRPIAGLSPQRYGSVNLPRYGGPTPYEIIEMSPKRVIEWREAGRKKNNIVVFGFDLTAKERGNPYETWLDDAIGYLGHVVDNGSTWGKYPWGGEGPQEGNVSCFAISTFKNFNNTFKLYCKDW